MRLSAFKPLSALAGGYVNLMRSIPLVLVIFWFFFLVPYIGAWIIGADAADRGRRLLCRRSSPSPCSRPPTTARSCAPASSRSRAARCGRATRWASTTGRRMGYIVLPQAFRNMLPVLLTQTIILFQDTSLVYVISATDFLGAAVQGRQPRLPPGRDVHVRRGGVLRHLVSPLAARQAASRTGSPDHPMISHQERQQVVRQLPGARPTAPPRSPRARWSWSAAPRAAASRRSSRA